MSRIFENWALLFGSLFGETLFHKDLHWCKKKERELKSCG